jgi:hypothetical protein
MREQNLAMIVAGALTLAPLAARATDQGPGVFNPHLYPGTKTGKAKTGLGSSVASDPLAASFLGPLIAALQKDAMNKALQILEDKGLTQISFDALKDALTNDTVNKVQWLMKQGLSEAEATQVAGQISQIFADAEALAEEAAVATEGTVETIEITSEGLIVGG